MTRCAIYARYSSDLQHDRSIDDQIRNCRHFAELRKWMVIDSHVYCDRATSGTTLAGRKGLGNLLTAADSNTKPFDYVLIDDTSRLSRNKIEQGTVIRDLLELGIYIYFVSDSIDTRDEITQDVILPVYGIKDSLYCRELAKKTKRGMTGQVLKGYNAGGRTYGYTYHRVPDPSGIIDKKTHQVQSLGTRVEVDQAQAAVIRRIFALYAEGYGLKAIATALTDDGIEPPGADRQFRNGSTRPSWCPNAIRVMLQNPKYIGDWTWNRTISTRRAKTGKRTYKTRPQEEWVSRLAPELAIVESGLWEKVQGRFQRQSIMYSKGEKAPRRKYLLSGLLKCGVCGASLVVVDIKKDGEILYRCAHNWQRGVKACSNSAKVSGRYAEDHILGSLKAELLSPQVLDFMAKELNQILSEQKTEGQSDIAILKGKRQKLTQDIQRLITLVTESETPLPSVKTVLQSKEQELAAVDRQLATIRTSKPMAKTDWNPDGIRSWFWKIDNLMKEDVSVARQQLLNIVSPLEAVPAEKNGQAGMLLTGNFLFGGVLNLIAEGSNLQNGGGRI